MANAVPFLTTDTLVQSVQRRILFPITQNTFTYNDIVEMANEELLISAVPALMEEHEEYLVYKTIVPLVNGIAIYPIPPRALGMVLRDVKYSDSNGNYFDVSRIAPEDKAFFQQSNGSNQSVGKYYLEGNNVVLTPQINAGATGSLNFFFYLRPNQLVSNTRASQIQYFIKKLDVIDNTLVQYGDTVEIVTGNETPDPVQTIFTAVQNITGAISSFTQIPTGTQIVFAVPHGITSTVVNIPITIAGVTGASGLNGSFEATVVNASTVLVSNLTYTGVPVGGVFVINNGFEVGVDATATTSNLINAINSASISGVQAIVSTDLSNALTISSAQINYTDISTTFTILNAQDEYSVAWYINSNDYIDIQFETNPNSNLSNGLNFAAGFPSTWLDPVTNQRTNLFVPGALCDFIKTDPGHQTYTFDVTLISNNNNIGRFRVSQLMTFMNNSSGGTQMFYPIHVGDYVCLQNECIIPQIPPELHSVLAERTAGRVLMALGDKDAYAISQARVQEMNKHQNALIGSRVSGSLTKVFNRYSLLRMGKSRFRRRY